MAKPCIHCQNLLADNAQFCERCGTRQPATPPQKKNGGLIAICISLAVVALAAIIVVCVLSLSRGGNGNSAPAPQVPVVTEPAETQQEDSVAVPDGMLPHDDGRPDSAADNGGQSGVLPGGNRPSNDESAFSGGNSGGNAPSNHGGESAFSSGGNTGGMTPGSNTGAEVQMDVDTFNQMMEGVWVDLSSVEDLWEDDHSFALCQFIDGQMWFAYYPGDGSRFGTVTNVVEAPDGTFQVTFWYQEEVFFDEYYEEEYITYTMELYDTQLVYRDNPDIVWTWMGYDLDSARAAVNAMY